MSSSPRSVPPAQVLWDFENPLHPPKQFVLPQTDPLVKIKLNGQRHEVEPIYDDAPRTLFNVRSCDVAGIAFLTRMHEAEPADASYLRRAHNLTIISLACTTPCPAGFCVCTDSGPFLSGGYDLQLTDLGGSFLVEVGSEKGEAAMAKAPDLFRKATEDAVTQRKALEAAAKTRFGPETCHFASAMRRISTGRVPDALWEKMADWCLECGGCNFVCPTCYCFSVKDLRQDGTWVRCRTWDSCQYAAFTLEASGTQSAGAAQGADEAPFLPQSKCAVLHPRQHGGVRGLREMHQDVLRHHPHAGGGGRHQEGEMA